MLSTVHAMDFMDTQEYHFRVEEHEKRGEPDTHGFQDTQAVDETEYATLVEAMRHALASEHYRVEVLKVYKLDEDGDGENDETVWQRNVHVFDDADGHNEAGYMSDWDIDSESELSSWFEVNVATKFHPESYPSWNWVLDEASQKWDLEFLPDMTSLAKEVHDALFILFQRRWNR